MHRQPAREPPCGDSSILPEELPYAVGQLERLVDELDFSYWLRIR